MTPPPDLSKLSHAEKDALILALIVQLAAAQERIAAQDARIAGTGGAARRTDPPAEDPGQLVQATLTGPEAGSPAAGRSPRPQEPARCGPDTASES